MSVFFKYFIYTDSESPTLALGYGKEFSSSTNLIIKEMCWFANFQECDPLVKNMESKKCEFGKCCCLKFLPKYHLDLIKVSKLSY